MYAAVVVANHDGLLCMRTLFAIIVTLAIAAVVGLLWSHGATRDACLVTAPIVSTPAVSEELAALDEGAEAARIQAPHLHEAPQQVSGAQPHAHVFGRVVDERGQALAGVEVRLTWRNFTRDQAEVLDRKQRTEFGNAGRSTSTDSHGCFAFEGSLPAAETSWLSIIPSVHHRSVHVRFSQRIGDRSLLVAGENDVGDIVVLDCGAIEGRVVDASGSGLESARVYCNLAAGPPSTADTLTDRDGRFVLGHLPDGQLAISAVMNGRNSVLDRPAFVRVGLTTTIEDIVLASAPSISGTVVRPDGTPAKGATVRASGKTRGTWSIADSDELGAFRVFLRRDEPHTLSILSSDRYAGSAQPATEAIEYEPGREDVKLVAALERQLTIQVLDKTTRLPIDTFGADISKKSPDGARMGSTGRRGDRFQTHDQLVVLFHKLGRITVAWPPEAHVVTVDAPGFVAVQVELGADATDARMQTIALERGGTLSGRLVGADASRPSTWVTLQLVSPAETTASSAIRGQASTDRTDFDDYARRRRVIRTLANGAFKFDGLPSGTYVLESQGGDAAPLIVRDIAVTSGINDVGDLQLDPGGMLTGYLAPPSNELPIGFAIDLVRLSDGHPLRDRRDTRHVVLARLDGAFECRGLVPGTYGIQWSRPEGANAAVDFGDGSGLTRVEVTTRRTAAITVDASVSALCAIAVRVERSGAPLANVKIEAVVRRRFQAEAKSARALGSTNAEGKVDAAVESGLPFTLRISDAQNLPLYVGDERIEPRFGTRIERVLRLEFGEVELDLPRELDPPMMGALRILLTRDGDPWRSFSASAGTAPFTSGDLVWKSGSIVLGSLPIGTYGVELQFQSFEPSPARPNAFVTTEMRVPFKTQFSVAADRTTRVAVR